MSAALLACLFLVAALWAWGAAAAVSLPVRSWDVSLRGVQGTLAPGQAVTLLRERPSVNGAATQPQIIGSAVVRYFTPGFETAGRVTIGSIKMNRGIAVEDATMLAPEGAAAEAAASILGATAIPVFPTLYLQGGLVLVILLTGMVVIFLFVGVRPRSVDFLIATDGEMRKVNWSTRKTIRDSTYVVIVACFLISGILFFIDFLFSSAARIVGLLQ